jgi:hypothetical protein
MKRSSLLLSALFIAALAIGQNEKYYQKMGETLGQFGSCSTVEDFQNLANQFHVIASVETGEWLPLYYEAHCYVLMSFLDGQESAARDGYLDRAESLIDQMTEKAPDEAEVYVMKAFFHTGRLVVDPPGRAMNTTPMINAALGKALNIEPNNPRAQFLLISNELGTARYFGSDIAPICEKARQLLQSWDDYPLKSPIYPNWGRNETEGIVSSCGE